MPSGIIEEAGFRIQRGSSTPLYEQISRWLLDEVDNGRLQPGDRAPSEFELARTYSVSRTTVRKALEQLVQEGVLYRRPGLGTFVSTHRIEFGASSSESFSATMDALGMAHSTVVLSASLVQAPVMPARHLRLRADTPVVCVHRLRLIGDEPAALHTTYLPTVYQSILDRDLTGSLHAAMRAVGAIVASTDDEVEAVPASGEAVAALGVPDGTPLLRMTGTGYSASGEPLRYTEGLYRGDAFRFRLGALSSREMRVLVKPQNGRDPGGASGNPLAGSSSTSIGVPAPSTAKRNRSPQ